MTIWDILSSPAAVVGGFATFIAVILAAITFWFERRKSRRSYALETYRSYLELCIQYPHLSCSRTMATYLRRQKFGGIANWNTAKSEQCLWFLSHMLHSMESIYDATEILGQREKNWEAVVKAQLTYHRRLLLEVWTDSRAHYGMKFRKLVDDYVDAQRATGAAAR